MHITKETTKLSAIKDLVKSIIKGESEIVVDGSIKLPDNIKPTDSIQALNDSEVTVFVGKREFKATLSV